MAFGLPSLDDIADLGSSLNPFDDDKKAPKRPKKKTPKRPTKVPKTTSTADRSHDVPIPRSQVSHVVSRAEENKRNKYKVPPPPKPKRSTGGFFKNVAKGVYSMPGDMADMTTMVAHAVASDARSGRGVSGLAWWLTDLATPSKDFGAKGPWEFQKAQKKEREALEKQYRDLIKSKSTPRDELDAWYKNRKGEIDKGKIGNLAEQMIRGTASDVQTTFGFKGFDYHHPLGNMDERREAAQDMWYSNPIGAIGAAAIVAGPASRVGSAVKVATRIKRLNPGISTREAMVMGAAESFRPGVTGIGKEAGGVQRSVAAWAPTARHPIGRGAQAMSDIVSKHLPSNVPLSETRRVARAAGRATKLDRKRAHGAVLEHIRPIANYINHGRLPSKEAAARVRGRRNGNSYNLRRGRDAAIFAALQGDRTTDPLLAVRAAIGDTDAQIKSGVRLGGDGDAGDLHVDDLPGQEVYVNGRHGKITDVSDNENRVHVEYTDPGDGPASESVAVHDAHLIDGDSRVNVPLSEYELRKLGERRAQLKMALAELEGDPEALNRFSSALLSAERLAAKNEQLGRRWAGDVDHWDEVGTRRRNLMLDRWKNRNLAEADVALDSPARQQFLSETIKRFGADEGKYLTSAADAIARSVNPKNPEEWWAKRIAETTSEAYDDFRKRAGAGLMQEAGPRRGLLKSRHGPELRGTAAWRKRGPGAAQRDWYYGVTPRGDGQVDAWNARTKEWEQLEPRELDRQWDDMRAGQAGTLKDPDNPGYFKRGMLVDVDMHHGEGPQVTIRTTDDELLTGPVNEFARLPMESIPESEAIFFSKAQRVVDEKMQSADTVDGIKALWKKNGVKDEEIEWMGMDVLEMKYGKKSVPKEEVQNHLENSLNSLNLDEMVYSSISSEHRDRWGPSSGYSSEGLVIKDPSPNEPYYELVLTMPPGVGIGFREGTHWSELENPIFHVRFHEIVDSEGKRAILIDEIQSDWHRIGRAEGYTKEMPPAVKAEVERLQAQIVRVNKARLQVIGDDSEWSIRNENFDVPRRWLAQLPAEQRDAIHMRLGSTNPYNNWWKEDPAFEQAISEFDPTWAGKRDKMPKLERLDALLARAQNARREAAAGYEGRVGDVPWKSGQWTSLAMKRILRWAADMDETPERIYWTRGHEHMVRYGKYDDLELDRSGSIDMSDYEYGESNVTVNHGEILEPKKYREPPLSNVYQERVLGPDGVGSQPERIATIEGSYERGLGDQPTRHVIESDDIDSDHLGDNYIFLESEGRFAKVLEEDGDKAVVETVPPEVEPARVDVHYVGPTGAYGGDHHYSVEVYDRYGDIIFHHGQESEMDPVDFNAKEFFEEMKNAYSPAGGGEYLFPPGSRGAQALEILGDGEWGENLGREIYQESTTGFDQYAYDEALQYASGGKGDFDHVKSFQSSYADPSKSHLNLYDKMLRNVTDKIIKPYKGKTTYHENVYTGRFSTESDGAITDEGLMDAWGFDVTPEMLADVKTGQALFQKPPAWDKLPKGAMELLSGTVNQPGRTAIRLFDDADVSTVLHELAHVGLYDLPVEALGTIEKHLAAGRSFRRGEWTATDHERFARNFERYFLSGEVTHRELLLPMNKLREWMKRIYHISKNNEAIPVHPEVRQVFDEMLAEPTSTARAYVPHTGQFDPEISQFLGGVRMPAGGNVLGVPQRHRKAFPKQRNREVLWESGQVAPSVAPLVSQLFRRLKYDETMNVRSDAFAEAHAIDADTVIPQNAILVRNPHVKPQRITERTRAMTNMDHKEFDQLDHPLLDDDPTGALNGIDSLKNESFAKLSDHPYWETDYENVRWIEPEKIKGILEDVFPSAPRGKVAASVGSANAMTRLAQIYLRPFRYVLGNLPANVILLGLTNPSQLGRAAGTYAAASLAPVFRAMGKTAPDLRHQHPELYQRIKTEGGDVQAQAGLPDFYTVANNNFQKTEQNLNRWSGTVAEKLGEVTDQPFRVASWVGWARRYGFKTADDWETLLKDADELREMGMPEDMVAKLGRVRNEIAQRTRDDMIDFDTLTPGERQNIARYFYLWAFTRGFVKWPVSFAQNYPERAALGLVASEASRDEERDIPSDMLSVRDASRSRGFDFSALNPISGGVEALQDIAAVGSGDIGPIAGRLSPTLKAIVGEGRPTKWTGEGSWAQEAADIYVPPSVGQFIPGTKAAARREEGGALKGAIEWGRFEVPKYSPKVKKDRDADWEELGSDYSLIGGTGSPPEVINSFRAYWISKELEGRIEFGIAKRQRGRGLTEQEKALTRASAYKQVYGGDVPTPKEILAASSKDAELYNKQLEDIMFTLRERIHSQASRVKAAYEGQGVPLPGG